MLQFGNIETVLFVFIHAFLCDDYFDFFSLYLHTAAAFGRIEKWVS